jgi:hypothetical protein
VVSTFAGRKPFSEETLARVAELARIYRLDLAAMLDARAEEGRGGE